MVLGLTSRVQRSINLHRDSQAVPSLTRSTSHLRKEFRWNELVGAKAPWTAYES
jgi:hypothetical protein